MQEMQAWSLDQEDPLEEEMATHTNIFAWKIPWRAEANITVHGVAKSQTWLSTHFKEDIQMANKHEKMLNITNY